MTTTNLEPARTTPLGRPPGREDGRAALGAVCWLLAGNAAVGIAALALFYALEVQTVGDHVFGPLSDVGTVTWDLLFVVLVVGLGGVIRGSRTGRMIMVATMVISLAGAVAAALLVVEVLAFEIATAIAVAAILTQSLWLHVVSRQLRRDSGWSRKTILLGWWAPVGQAVGAVLVGGSLVFGWMTTPQLVIMMIGLVPGLLSWCAWPVWFAFAARDVGRS